MKNIDKYIKFVFRMSVMIEAKNKNDYLSMGRGKYSFEPENNIDVDLFLNKERREFFRDNVYEMICNRIDSIKSSMKYSAYSNELDYLKSQWFDIWETDSLNFKEEYLKGSIVCGERKGLDYWKMVSMFEWDVVRIKYLEIIKSRIDELESEKKEGFVISEFKDRLEHESKSEIDTLPKVIMLLNEVGFFDLPIIKSISSDTQRGEFVNTILRINDDNTRKYISGLQGKDKKYNPLKYKELCNDIIKLYKEDKFQGKF